MYKYIGMGLFGLFIMMVLPSGMDSLQEQGKFYGAAHLLVRDAAGNELLSQTVHNTLLDSGEVFIIDQAFTGGAADVLDTNQISAICVTDVITISEGSLASDFSGANNNLGGTNHCHFTIPDHVGDGTVILGSVTFTGGIDVAIADTIRSIAICNNNAGADYLDCDTPANGIAMAAIATSAVQLGDTETVDITYTFDLSSLNT